jgi:hypothetical protein
MRTTRALALVFGLIATTAAAQTPFSITAALVAPSRTVVSVSFSDQLAPGGPQTDTSRAHLTGAPGVTVTAIAPSLVENDVLTVTLSGPVPPGNVEICFDRVSYVRASKTITTTAELCSAIGSDIATAKDAALKTLTDTPLPADEKTLNASGFVTTASEKSEGGADIAFNPKLQDPNAKVFFRLKKATADEGDARNLEIGGSYRVGIPWNRAQLVEMRDATDLSTVGRILRERQQAFIAGMVVNFVTKLEADPSHFEAANGVAEVHYQILSMTKALAGTSGFWRGYVIPAGSEIGRRLGVDEKGEPTSAHDLILRYKAGGGFRLYFENTGNQFPIRRVDFDFNGIWRYLGRDEVLYNSTTEALDRTTRGDHGYAQIDLKLMLAETASGMYGVKASFNRGSLPPTFAPVKSFQFGFVIESRDNQ